MNTLVAVVNISKPPEIPPISTEEKPVPMSSVGLQEVSETIENAVEQVKEEAVERGGFVLDKVRTTVASSKRGIMRLEDIYEKSKDGVLVRWNREDIMKGLYNTTTTEVKRGIDWVTDLTLIDLLRDVFMLFPLTLSAIPLPFFFGHFVDFFNIIFSLELWPFWFPLLSPIVHLVKLIVLTMIGAFAMLIFSQFRRKDPDEILEGHEVVEWENKSLVRVWIPRICAMIMLLLYIPVVRDCIDIFACGRRFRYGMVGYQDCLDIRHILYILAAITPFLLFAVYFPVYLFITILEVRPGQRKYNIEGKAAHYASKEQLFRADVKRDKSSYRFLYSGYKYRYSSYKIYLLCLKFIIICILTVSVSSGLEFLSATAPFVLLTILWLFHVVTNPFSVKSKNFTAASVFLMLAILCLVGFSRYVAVLFFPTLLWIDILFEVLLFCTFFTCLFAFVLVLLFANDAVRTLLKNVLHRVDFTYDGEWEIWEEGKRRIWYRFWDSLFANSEEMEGARKRLEELKDIASKIGEEKYREAMSPVSVECAEIRKQVISRLEGVDVYWDGKPENRRKVRDKSKFGKLYIEPFPYRAIFVYDNAKDFCVIEKLSDLKRLLELNQREDILAKRLIRTKLRCLDGESVFFPWKENKVKPFGMEFQRTDEITFNFTEGLLKLHSKSTWGPGFDMTIGYIDGVGEGQNGKKFADERLTIGLRSLGVKDDFESTELLEKLFTENSDLIQVNYTKYMGEVLAYRKELLQERVEKERVLSTGFWSHIYNNPNIPQELLEKYLKTREVNEAVSAIPEEHEIGIHYLYQRISYYYLHPSVSYWYCWFDDLWKENKSLPEIQRNAELICPEFPDSIAYGMIPRDKLIRTLKQAGLFSVIPYHLLGRKQVNDLYANVNDLNLIHEEKISLESKTGEVGSVEPSAPADDENAEIGEDMDILIGMNGEVITELWEEDFLYSSAPPYGSSIVESDNFEDIPPPEDEPPQFEPEDRQQPQNVDEEPAEATAPPEDSESEGSISIASSSSGESE